MSKVAEAAGISFDSIRKAIAELSMPIKFGTDQGWADSIIVRLKPIECDKCEEDGRLPGKHPPISKRVKCKRCHGIKRGYSYAGAHYWTGWSPLERREVAQ